MSELEPCPFCGWKDLSWRVEYYSHDWSEYAVYCGNCEAESAMTKTREAAADLWNRRTPRYAHRNGETEPPEVAGWYWFSGLFRNECVCLDDNCVEFWLAGYEYSFDALSEGWTDGRWWGPIEPPFEETP